MNMDVDDVSQKCPTIVCYRSADAIVSAAREGLLSEEAVIAADFYFAKANWRAHRRAVVTEAHGTLRGKRVFRGRKAEYPKHDLD